MGGAIAGPSSLSEGRDSFSLRKGVEGYIVTHTWQTEIELSKAQQKIQGPYPIWDYHTEEFAYSEKEDAIECLYELVD